MENNLELLFMAGVMAVAYFVRFRVLKRTLTVEETIRELDPEDANVDGSTASGRIHGRAFTLELEYGFSRHRGRVCEGGFFSMEARTDGRTFHFSPGFFGSAFDWDAVTEETGTAHLRQPGDSERYRVMFEKMAAAFVLKSPGAREDLRTAALRIQPERVTLSYKGDAARQTKKLLAHLGHFARAVEDSHP